MDKKYILFDLDGTLTDPRVGITQSVAYALRQFGIEVDEPEKSLLSFIGPPLMDSFMSVYGFTKEQAAEGVRQYRVRFTDGGGIFENDVYEGIPQMLATLKAMGKCLILATSKPEPYARMILEHFDLDRYFDHICGATMDETRTAKADVIAYALESAHVAHKAQAVMVGDRKHDIEGAAANGLDSIGVLFGYGSPEELSKAGAGRIAATVGELSGILRGQEPRPLSGVIFFPCGDIERTKEYYTQVVGLEIYKDMGSTVWFDTGRGYIAFVCYGDGRPMASGQCISFNMASRREVDEVYERLRKNGRAIGLEKGAEQHPRFPVYSFFMSDPDGYTLEYQKVDE